MGIASLLPIRAAGKQREEGEGMSRGMWFQSDRCGHSWWGGELGHHAVQWGLGQQESRAGQST